MTYNLYLISYGLGMLAGAFYTFGYAFEITSTTLENIRFWLRIEYIGIPFGATIWIIMVFQYTEISSASSAEGI